MRNIKYTLTLLLLLISSSTLAFMPTTGLWGVDSEDNGLPGRGFQIEAENGIIVLTYFGYRSDGSSVFYIASGPIINNNLTSALLNIQGGTSLGGVHKDASISESPGLVTISFSSGKHGIIVLPGEPQRAISKKPFGYADGPEGLLGTWIFTRIEGQTPLSEIKVLSVNTGIVGSSGNGFVSTAESDFLCEYQITGDLTGTVVCGGQQGTGSILYRFKFSGDKGTGTASVRLPTGEFSASQEMHALRIATNNGIKTGLNDGTDTSLTIHSQLAPSGASIDAK